MGEIKPLLRTNLSSVAIFKLILDINIQAIREVKDENKENPGEYAKTILELGGTLADIPKMGSRWEQIFIESRIGWIMGNRYLISYQIYIIKM